jgi:hypothetical protein
MDSIRSMARVRQLHPVEILTAILIPVGPVIGQSSPQSGPLSSMCSYENALEIILQQVYSTRTFDDSEQRIRVLIRGADFILRKSVTGPAGLHGFQELID